MPGKRGDLTKWAATFHVAAELARRGWRVGLTHGNTPVSDILAIHDSGRQVTIDAKGIIAPGHWFGNGLLGEARKRRRHFVLFVALPEPPGDPRVYVVPGAQAVRLAELSVELSRARGNKGAAPNLWEESRASVPEAKPLRPYRDRWDLLLRDSEQAPRRAGVSED